MTLEQLSEQMIKNNSEISAIRENLKSAHKRIDDNDRITEGIHKLAANVETLALQVKLLTDNMETSVEKLESSLESQSKRIASLEKKPAMRWESLVTQLIGLVIAAVAGGLLSKFF